MKHEERQDPQNRRLEEDADRTQSQACEEDEPRLEERRAGKDRDLEEAAAVERHQGQQVEEVEGDQEQDGLVENGLPGGAQG
jgi:hypothetical protein